MSGKSGRDMGDDEFMKQFREAPSADFSRKLYDQLKEEDEMIKSIVATPSLAGVQHSITRKTVKPYWLTLAAAILAMLLFGGLMLFPHQSQDPVATATPILSNLQPITMENADRLQLIQEIGTGIITDAAWSPDGKTIALAGVKGIWLHDAHDLKAEARLLPASYNSATRRLTFSPDSQWIAATNGDDVLVWDTTSGEVVATLTGHKNLVNAVAFSPDGKWLATGGGEENNDTMDNTIRLWDTTTWEIGREITGQSSVVTNLAFSPDGTILASENLDKHDAVYLWDAVSGTLLNTLRRTTTNWGMRGISFSPDGQTLAMADGAGSIVGATLWDVESGKKRGLITLNNQSGYYFGGFVHDLAYSPDGQLLVTATDVLQAWNFQTVGFMANFDKVSEMPTYSYDVHFAFSPDSSKVVVVRSNQPPEVVDLQANERQVIAGYKNTRAYALALTRDNSSIVYISGDGWVRSYDPDTDTEQNRINVGTTAYERSLSSDGNVVASVKSKLVTLFGYVNQFYPGIELVDIASGQELITLSSGDIPSSPAIFSPNDRYVVNIVNNGNLSNVYRWDFGQGHIPAGNLSVLDNYPATFWVTAFSKDSELLALGGYKPGGKGIALLIDTLSGRILHTIDADEAIQGLAFSPNGRTLAVGSHSGIHFLDVQRGLLSDGPEGDYADNSDLVYSSDGGLLMAKSQQGLLLWDMNRADTAVHTLLHWSTDESNNYQYIAVSSDWRYIVTSGFDGIIRIWGVPG